MVGVGWWGTDGMVGCGGYLLNALILLQLGVEFLAGFNYGSEVCEDQYVMDVRQRARTYAPFCIAW